MNVILTSDFPSTANQVVVDCMRSRSPRPRIAWIPPFTKMGRERFPAAQELFKSHGFSDLEYCDIDEEPDEGQLARLDQYDVVYLTGGDPIGFRRNILDIALVDGAAVLHTGGDDYRCVGRAMRFRRGVMAPIEGAAKNPAAVAEALSA